MGIWLLLIQFVLRLTFGVALSMAVTPSRLVSGGFYRVHLWVLLGLNTFAALAAWTQGEVFQSSVALPRAIFGVTAGLAVASYVGAVLWLYEFRRLGNLVLWMISGGGLLGAWGATLWPSAASAPVRGWIAAAVASSGLLLGVTLTAMLLGHWYLNTPSMQLRPLQRLIRLLIGAVLIRMAVAAMGLVLVVGASDPGRSFWILSAFRWLAGLLVVLVLSIMTWQTLKVPNTQSATGILYAAVILTFLGELTAELLSVDAMYPL